MSKKNVITMTGSASVAAVPDLMSISLTVEARHDRAQDAYVLAAQRSSQVVAALSASAPRAKLSTTGIGLRSRTSWRNEENVVIGYEADSTLQLSQLELAQVSEVLSAAVAAGGDGLRIDSVSAEVSDPTTAQDQAREFAYANARAKAEQLATLAGCSLGRTLSIKENQAGSPTPIIRVKATTMAASSMPIIAGEQEQSVHLEVSWELKSIKD